MEKLDPNRIENILALTPVQEGMLFHYLQTPQGELYFEQLSLEISGKIDVGHFEKAWNVVIETNDMLRAVFRWEKLEKPSQIILKEHEFKVIFYDISDKNDTQKKSELEEIKKKDRSETFDLRQVPFRVILCKLEEKKHAIIISNHHILYDGWSNGIILKEFFKAYHDLCNNVQVKKLPEKPPFKEYIRWIQNLDKNRHEKFWREYLADFETPTELPIKRQVQNRTRSGDYSIILGGIIKAKLDNFAKNNRATLASIFYTAWGILLQKYCDTEDVIFGTTVSGRSCGVKGIEDMIGLFINTIPLRINTYPGETIIDVVLLTDQVLRDREEFENTPLVDIQSYRSLGGSGSLFDTIVTIENYPLDDFVHGRDVARNVSTYSMVETTHYDLTVGIMPFKGIDIKFSYKQELFDNDTIENLAGHFKRIIRDILENPETGVSQLDILSREEKSQILFDFNNTAAEYPTNKTIHQLFAEQAEQTPDHIALVGAAAVETLRATSPQIQTTYRQLNEQSNILAQVLMEKGILPDDIIGIMMERSVEMIIGIMGILKSGGAYLPIDIEYPKERIDYMLKDSNARILLRMEGCQEEIIVNCQLLIVNCKLKNLPKTPPHHSSLILNGRPRRGLHHSNQLAYIIYTSGSTGKPKGVMIENRSVINFIKGITDIIPFQASDRILSLTTISFDIFGLETILPLTKGSTTIIGTAEEQQDAGLGALIMEREAIAIFQATPSRLRLFIQAPGPGGILKRLKYLLVGGETFPEELLVKLKRLTDGSIYNVYGPTETTIWSSIKKVSGDNTLNIGKPLVNTFIYILNRDRKLQPVGVAGEIRISGEGVSRGYINRPELTAEKFPINPFINGARLYCTGDIGRWLPDGNIECLGRIDQQVKLRGFRIELGEIENFLLKHDGIKDAVVVLKEDENHDQNLAAYFVSEIELPGAELREYLLKNLPGYMIPLYFVQLEKIPLTPSGKVDRRALPEPGTTLEENPVMPGNEIESKLAIIWSEVLGIPLNKIGIDGNFFFLGGHSLKITRLASIINRQLDSAISLTQLFKRPTIRLQARYLREMTQRQTQRMENIPLQPLQPAPIRQYYDLSYAQRRLWIVCQFEEDSIAYNEVGGLTITGKFNPAAFDRAIRTLAQRHESLRTVFVVVNGEPKQKILPRVDLKLQQEDLRHLKGERLETEAAKIIKNTANKAFNLEKGPLAAFKLLHLEDEKYFLLANIHHIVNDGWSIGVIKNELNTLYDFHNKNRSADDPIPLPPVKFQYKDYTMWHNRLIADGYFDKIKEYWLEKFKDKPTGIELPLDHPRGTVQTFNGGRVYYRIEEKDVLALRKTCERAGENATLFMKLMTLLSILLHKYSGENDIIIGSPIAGRKQPELHRIIGFLVNTLAYRMKVEPTESFRQLLLNVKKETLTCYENQDYPFDILVEILGLARDLSRSPLFNVMMAFGDADTSGEDMRFEWTDVKFHSQIEGFDPSLFDLVFFIDERGKHLDCEIMYNSDLYERSTIQRMADNFLTLLKNVLENSDKPIFDLEYIEKEEYRTIIHRFNRNKQDFQPDAIQELVEKQVEKSPDRVAVVSPEGWAITYDEINKRANQLAHYLRRSYGMGPGEIVGICIARSLEMIIAVLGVVKSGAGYLSFDPNYPRARVRHMIEDSRAGLVLIDQSRPDLFDAEETKENGQIPLNIHKHWPRIRGESPRNLQIQNKLSDIVYVIYTSGSTGAPNGAMLSHAILSNLIQWQATCTEIDGSLRCLQFTSINFCVSFQEIFTTLCSGGEVHLIGDIERQDIDFLVEYLARRKIGNLYLPFSYLNFLFTHSNKTGPGDKSYKTSLKNIITAGEQLKITGGMKKFLDQNPSIKLHNHYGSSEMHVVTAYTLDASGAAAEPVPPVGKPIANTRIYILDENEKPVPIGVWGELFVAGSHEVPGYIHNPVLTDKKSVWNPTLSAVSGRRLYRSGDVGRWLEDGNIELKGRKDFQVKIRGFRVEPSEIESKILTLDKVKDCVVVVNENSPGEKILAAYVVTDGLDVAEIKRYLGNYLPQYMIPKFMILERLPLLPNGKVDREKLPGLPTEEVRRQIKGLDILNFENEIEEKVAGIWADLLGVDKGAIDKEDNFFELGGHSLKATTMMTLIHKEFNVRLKLIDIFKTPTIREIAASIGRVAKESFSRIPPVEKKEYYVLSSAQKRMYILQQMDIEGIGYNMSRGMVLEGDVDLERLESAVKNLVERHEAFRTSFHMTNNDVVQVIHDNVAFEIEKNLESPGEGYLKKFIRPFDLSHAPLLRIGLVKTAGKRYLLIVDMHHIISDGISIEILVHEFTTLYPGETLPPINPQYKDYAEWQNRLKQEENLLRQKAYWRKEFEGEIPVLELPTDYARPAVQSFEGDTIAFSIRSETVESLHLFALETGTTLYMVLSALYNILLAKLGAQEEIIIGTPIAGRGNADLEKVIGVFVNTLPLRNYPVGEKIFAGFLEEVKEKTLEIFENQEYQYDDLVEQLAIKRDTGRNPLFDAMFVLQNMGSGEIEIPGLKIASFDLETTTSKFDLTLTGVEIEGKLNFSFEYCTKLFKPGTIERFISYFKNIILGVLQDKCKRLADLEIITQEEKNRILYEFNLTNSEYPQNKTVHDLFTEQVTRTPNRISLVGASAVETLRATSLQIQITYRQLNEQSNQLAVLLTEKGVLPDSIVGIMAERSVEMIIGIIGILKSGGAYMPIDPDYPGDRINYMLKDSGAISLIGMEEYQKKIIVNCQLLIVNCKREALRSHSREQAPHHHSSFIIHHSNRLAYIIYTSGTTGQPKGSLIEHRNVVRLLFNDKFQFDFTGRDVWTLFHSFCFDFSVWEMYGALLYGGKLVIVPTIVARDTSEFLGLLAREAVTVLNQTPSAFYNLVNEVLNPRRQGTKLYINYVIFGGEALKPSKLKDWRENYPQTRLINMFGITETTVHATYKKISGKDIELNISGVGKPIPTIRTYILDKYLNPVPLGVAGEIYIGGDGVGRGYLNRVELTEGKFIKNPYKPGDRLYRSGDMGRFLENGEMAYTGRIDHQVKIRGFRIELAEIENRLLQYDGIKEAVIRVEETATDKYLCAYIVSLKEITLMELRTHLAGKLPDYMIPSYFVRLEQIPLTPNGKIDKKAFPRVHGNTELLAESAPPVTETEEKLVELWANTLGIRAGINIDFFLSGGDSIKAVRLVNLINTKFSTNLKIADIYLNGTIRSLASLIDRDKTDYEYTKRQLNGVAIELEQLKNKVLMNLRFPEEIEDIYPMSDIQRGMVFHSLKDIGTAMYHDQMVYQPTIKDFIPEIFKKAFNLLVEKHAILRTVFHFGSHEESLQVVYRKVHSNIEHNDISHMGKGEQENHLLRLLEEDKNQPFRFDIPPLWRLRTFDLGNDSICVVMVAHHAILDGWSVASLATELLNTYWKLKSNPAFNPGILKNSYKAFIIEQALEKKRGDAANFWKYELEGYKRLELPNGFQIKNNGNIVRKYRSKLGDELFLKLKATAKAHYSTLKNLCFSAYIYMLNMLSHEDEIVAGLVANNRPVCEDGDKILGCFLNTIPVRILIPGCISWLEYTKLVDRKLLQLKKYERTPLFEIVRIIGENTQNRNPIFDVIFNFIDFHVVEQIERDYEKNDSAKLHIEENITTNTAFDFSISTTLGDFELLISYSDSFFDEMTVKNMCFYFERVLNKFITDPGSIISKIELIPVDERHRLLYEFNDTDEAYPKNKVIHESFTEQVEKTPDRIAIIGSTISSPPMYLQMTYCQLNGQSNRLANILIEKGVAPDAIVGIMVERSIEMVIGIMGILKSGGAYLPIDPGYPRKRIDYMLKDSGAKLLVTTSDQEGGKVARWEGEKVLLEEIPKSSYPLTVLPSYLLNSSNLAYIIYTSGSTGKPKGVIVEHASVVNLLYAMQNKYPLEVPDAYLLKTPYVFDVSVVELFGWFLGGGRAVILEKEGHRDPRIIAEWIERYMVTHINFVPSMFRVFVDYVSGNIKTPLSRLKYIFLAGEVMLPELAERFRNLNTTVNLENIYGPTESTVYASKYSLSDWKSTGAVPIGKPLPNMKLYILSNHANIQPIGAAGELYIGGPGLARGYINRPEMTYQTFHLRRPAPPPRETMNKDYHPLPPNIYKTGDLARWLADGNIEFLGRIDFQVKIRGFRIELGEIESRLSNYPGIKEAVVLTREKEKENKYLCAYIVSNGELEIPGLRDYLAKELPVYMVPSYFVRMEKIPVTSNGKVDWKALPPVDAKTAGAAVEYAAPRNNIEKRLIEIWSEVLVGDTNRKLGIDDNFLELGGNSLDIFKVSNRIKQQLEKEIPVTVIFRRPTVRTLAAYLDQGTSDSTANNKKIFEVIDKGKNKLKKRMEKRKVKNQ